MSFSSLVTVARLLPWLTILFLVLGIVGILAAWEVFTFACLLLAVVTLILMASLLDEINGRFYVEESNE